MNQINQEYTVETSTIYIQGKPVTLMNRTPILSPEQREKRRREIEAKLYEVCRKYQTA